MMNDIETSLQSLEVKINDSNDSPKIHNSNEEESKTTKVTLAPSSPDNFGCDFVYVSDSSDAQNEHDGKVSVEAAEKAKMKIDDSVEKGWTKDIPQIFSAVCTGLLFGVVLERCKVFAPITFRKQFLFQRFIMLKTFLAAVATASICFAVLERLAPGRFLPVREKFMSSRAAKGLPAVIFGATLLGCGLAICGACPAMIFVQLGSGVSTAYLSLLGGLAGALTFGLLHPLPLVQSLLKIGTSTSHKLDDFYPLKGIPYPYLAVGFAACLGAAIAIFEHFFPWDSAAEIEGAETWSTVWAPEVSGVVVGILQVPTVLVASGTLGSSSTYMVSTLRPINIPLISPYFLPSFTAEVRK